MADSKPKTTLADSVTEFSLDLFNKTIHTAGNTNVFISPSSVYIVMAMLHVGARNKTLEQMTSSLKLEDLELSKMKEFASTLKKGSRYVSVHAANRLYPNADKSILDSYIKLIQEYFEADANPMDFIKDPEGSRLTINSWVEEQTKSKIKNLLPQRCLSADTRMVVVNAIYFKGQWSTPFEAKSTMKREFHVTKGHTVEVETMNKKFDDVKYGEIPDANCKILEIMYKGGEIGMVILLPNEVDGLQTLERNLSLKQLHSMMSLMFPETVSVALPKFKLETSVQMKPILRILGMEDMFDVARADFSGMGDQLFVSEVFHKAFVDVHEEGTEAAAATAAVMMLGCSLQARRLEFTADHPFMFLIWDHRLQAPLFIGRFIGPAEH